MSACDDGGPAFPHTRVYSDTPNDLMHQHLPMSGMSLRDYFAAKAIQGFMANKANPLSFHPEADAKWAYTIADAMLAAREQS